MIKFSSFVVCGQAGEPYSVKMELVKPPCKLPKIPKPQLIINGIDGWTKAQFPLAFITSFGESSS